MKQILSIIAILLLFSSCLRLDNNLFSNTKLSAYLLEANTAPQEITLDTSYRMSDSMINLFSITSDDNGNKATIYCLYLGNIRNIATDTVILYFHGTKDNMDYYYNRSKLLANIGWKNRFGVLMIDYRGYGMSNGTPSESDMHADGYAALDWLQSKELTGDRLVIYGFSLGTADATYLTANTGSLIPSKLILESPFASAATMVQDATLLAFPASYFTNLKIDNCQQIKKVEQPFLWMHGTADNFLQINTHGQVVFNNYKGTYGEAHRINGATHTNVPFIWGYENYKSALLKFITR
jgi:pimeloyl-ACP methyl ester carboxylesterase